MSAPYDNDKLFEGLSASMANAEVRDRADAAMKRLGETDLGTAFWLIREQADVIAHLGMRVVELERAIGDRPPAEDPGA